MARNGVDPRDPVTLYAIGRARTDAFLTTLRAGGSLVYSTFFSGGELDAATGVALDGSGDRYVAGVSHSPNFPVTAGAYQTTLRRWEDFLGTSFALKLGAP